MEITNTELLAGVLSGLAGKTCDFPFDTIKTVMQANFDSIKKTAATTFDSSSSSSTSAGGINSSRSGMLTRALLSRSKTLQTAHTIFKNDGLLGFYRGVASPLLGAALDTTVNFATYNATLEALGKAAKYDATAASIIIGKNRSNNGSTTFDLANPPMRAVVAAGMAAGFVTSAIMCPVELVKCRMQVQLGQPTKQYTNSLDCIAKTLRTEGPRGFTHGGLATLAREVPGTAAFFAVYELTLRTYFQQSSSSSSSTQQQAMTMPWYAVPVSGAVAGVCYSCAFYPADVVKTLVQTDPTFQRLSLRNAMLRVYRTGGLRALYSGVGITAIRSLPSNAAIFSVYELVVNRF